VAARRKAQHEERKEKRKERRIKHEEKEKGKSGAQVELKPHFILDLRFLFFLGLMATPTSKFSLLMAYTCTYNFFAL
jgi:hypothetical protein